jgi:TolB protein
MSAATTSAVRASRSPSDQAGWPRRRFLAATATAAAGALPAASWSQFRVEISGVGATQIPVAIAPFREESAAGVALSAVIRANLQRSGMFRTSEVMLPLDERSEIERDGWRGRGIDALVAGSVTRLADGRFDVRYKLWDVVGGEELIGQSKVVLAGDLRLAAHRVADEIHHRLTGEPGVNATRIAYVMRSGRQFTLHVTDADGEGGQIALTSPASIMSPAWSPDGARLAYVSFESGKAVVWTQDLSTGQRRAVADFRGTNSAPAWSPDGRRLAVTLSRGGVAQIFTVAAEGGGEPRQVTRSNAIDTEAHFAPDGRSLFFVSDRGGGPQIYRMAVDGGAPERVTFASGYAVSPSVSADGRNLAFISRQGNAYRLVVQDLNTGAVTSLTETGDDERPSFAPNGRLIAYATRQRGVDQLMTTTLDGRIKTRLASAAGADVRQPAWGPFQRG